MGGNWQNVNGGVLIRCCDGREDRPAKCYRRRGGRKSGYLYSTVPVWTVPTCVFPE